MKYLRCVACLFFASLFFSSYACQRSPHNELSLQSSSLPEYKAEKEDKIDPSFSWEDKLSATDNYFPKNAWDTSDVDVSSLSPQKKLIAFTFDDAPAQTLENILAVYAAYNEQNPDCVATATVFLNSKRFDLQTPVLLSTALAMGFELGNHTHSHYDLTTLSKEKLQEEIDYTDRLLYGIDGKRRHLLRAPYGRTNALLKDIAPAPLIDWTIDTLDWSGKSADEIYRVIYENRFDGAIVLMHDGYPHTVDALKRLLPDLKNDGYQVVNVSQLAKMHNCTLMNGHVYIRARKQIH